MGIAEKLADVTWRIADCESRIAEQQACIKRGNCEEAVEAAMLLAMAAGASRELLVYKARLEDLIAVKATDGDP